MNPNFRGRGTYPYRGGYRGRGYTSSSNRTNASSSNSNIIPIQGDPLYEEFQQFLKSKGSNTPSFSKIVSESDPNEENPDYKRTSHTDEIITLEFKDIMLYFENNNDPWFLMTRYLENASYAACSYKNRIYYENILKSTESVEFTHYQPHGNTTIHNFSKAIIKKLISPNEWGLNTLREREFSIPESKTVFKFTYWDYIDSFHKAFLYQNPNRKHTWFFKVCEKIYNQNKDIPNWFLKWWLSYGPSIDILPEEPFRRLYGEWLPISPRYKNAVTYNNIGNLEVTSSMHFFMEFSIPWIWKWEPIVDYTPKNFPTLRRSYLSRLWPRMLQTDPATKTLYGQDTIDHINRKIKDYKGQMEFRQRQVFPQITPENDKHSKEEIIKAYLAKMKEEIKRFDEDKISMMSENSQESVNSLQNLAGESQPLDDDIEIDEMVDRYVEELFKKEKKKPQ